MRDLTPGPSAGCELSPDDPTQELEALEQTASIEEVSLPGPDRHGLTPDPIPLRWILEGAPLARRKCLLASADGMSSTHLWDCTAGRFRWQYGSQVLMHGLEGMAFIEDACGVRHALECGGTFLFPAGSRFHWTVPRYVRQIAILHRPLSPALRLARSIETHLRRACARGARSTVWTG